jgi:hypothetical protein
VCSQNEVHRNQWRYLTGSSRQWYPIAAAAAFSVHLARDEEKLDFSHIPETEFIRISLGFCNHIVVTCTATKNTLRSPFAPALALRPGTFPASPAALKSSILCRGAVLGLPAAGKDVYPLSRKANALFGGVVSLDPRDKSDLYDISANSALSTECPRGVLSAIAVGRVDAGVSSQFVSPFEGRIEPHLIELLISGS